MGTSILYEYQIGYIKPLCYQILGLVGTSGVRNRPCWECLPLSFNPWFIITSQWHSIFFKAIDISFFEWNQNFLNAFFIYYNIHTGAMFHSSGFLFSFGTPGFTPPIAPTLTEKHNISYHITQIQLAVTNYPAGITHG